MSETSEMVLVESQAALYIPSPQQAKDAMDALQRVMQAILTDDDYAVIRGRKWRKRTAFAKLRRAFSVTVTDLEEAWEIATRGGMRLFECDIHLECCRLLLKMVESGEKFDAKEIVPTSPLALYNAPTQPLAAARAHLEQAHSMVEEMGYHRRDPEILIETARLQKIEGNKDKAQETLKEAEKIINKTGAHRWDWEVGKLKGELVSG